MLYYNKLTTKRKAFINQLYNLINTQFEEQEKLIKLESLQEIEEQEKKIKLIIEELENNPDYIQRIFIDAPWGMGKSFFSKALKEKIEEGNKTRGEEIKLININAWETDYFSDPMKSLIGEIDNSVGLSEPIKEEVKNFLSRGFQTLKKIGLKEVFGFIGEAGLNKVLDKVGITADKRKEIIDAYNETNEIDTDELEEYKKYKELVTNFKIALSEDEKLKVIVIDELDRCKPTYAIELLETIKHFFGVKNIIFVFLVNKEQLKSIVSTSYLTEDKCSEYFEKFFDIQFNLPEIEYEDFIQIEYDKYNLPQTYGVNNENVSEDNIKIYEAIFLEAFISNCDSSTVSPRNFIKSFKKFRVLLTSLSNEERACYPLMIVLILYFIKKEFLNKSENITLKTLFNKTFFISQKEKKSSNLVKNTYEVIVVSGVNYEIKDKYEKDRDFYLIFSKFIGEKSSSVNFLFIQELDEKREVNCFLLEDIHIRFKNLIYKIRITKSSYNGNEGNLFIEPHFFTNTQLLNYQTTKNSYNFLILLEWAEEKYNFTMNIK